MLETFHVVLMKIVDIVITWSNSVVLPLNEMQYGYHLLRDNILNCIKISKG